MGEGRQKGGRCRCGGAPTCNVTPLTVNDDAMAVGNNGKVSNRNTWCSIVTLTTLVGNLIS